MRGGVRLRGGVRETDDYTDRERERPTCGAAGFWGLFPGRRSSPRKSGHPQLSTKKVWSLDGVCLACVAGWWLDVAGYPVGEIADLQMHAKTKSCARSWTRRLHTRTGRVRCAAGFCYPVLARLANPLACWVWLDATCSQTACWCGFWPRWRGEEKGRHWPPQQHWT